MCGIKSKTQFEKYHQVVTWIILIQSITLATFVKGKEIIRESTALSMKLTFVVIF